MYVKFIISASHLPYLKVMEMQIRDFMIVKK